MSPVSSFMDASGPKKVISSAIQANTSTTIKKVKINLNGTGSFRIRVGTTDEIGNTITWEEITSFNVFVTLSNPNKVLYYEIYGEPGNTLFNTSYVPAVQIDIQE